VSRLCLMRVRSPDRSELGSHGTEDRSRERQAPLCRNLLDCNQSSISFSNTMSSCIIKQQHIAESECRWLRMRCSWGRSFHYSFSHLLWTPKVKLHLYPWWQSCRSGIAHPQHSWLMLGSLWPSMEEPTWSAKSQLLPWLSPQTWIMRQALCLSKEHHNWVEVELRAKLA